MKAMQPHSEVAEVHLNYCLKLFIMQIALELSMMRK